MQVPQKKTKQDEIIGIINNAVSKGTLSEFQFHRLLFSLKSIEKQVPQDWYNLINAISHMYHDEPTASYQFAIKVLKISENVDVLTRLYFIFINVWDLGSANETIWRMKELTLKQNLNLPSYIPKDYKLFPYYLYGNVQDFNSLNLHLDEESLVDYEILLDAQEYLNIEVADLKAISNIISKVLLSENIRCRKVEFSFIDNEFLILMFVDKNFSIIRKLNTLVFEECFKNNLTRQLNLLSYFFVPFDPEID